MNTHKTYTIQDAIKTLEHYCSYQERCHQEVVQKLQGMHMIPEAIDVVIVHLLQHNFLNEERFAKAYVSGKFKIKNWGKRRLTQNLKQKDINKTIINNALNEIDDDEYIVVFNALAEKKVKTLQDSNIWKKKKKLADYLLYRGWESDLVYAKVNELIT